MNINFEYGGWHKNSCYWIIPVVELSYCPRWVNDNVEPIDDFYMIRFNGRFLSFWFIIELVW